MPTPKAGGTAAPARGESRPWFAPLLRALLALLALFLAVAWLRRRYMRFEVVGDSMYPTYRHGDYLLVRRFAPGELPAPGDIVLAADPREPQRILLKRVENVDLHGQVTLIGDNPAASTDSRHFGPVAKEAILGRVAWRYWPLFRRDPGDSSAPAS